MTEQPSLWDEPDGPAARLASELDAAEGRTTLQAQAAGMDLLRDCLSFAVPLWIIKVADWPPAEQAEEVEVATDLIASASEGVVAPFERRSTDVRAARIFNVLARSLALLAHMPGGVTFLGDHWCTDHEACVAARTGGAA